MMSKSDVPHRSPPFLPLFAIGIAGRIGSGKSSLGRALASRLDCIYASFGEYVRHLACQRGLPDDRTTLQGVGQEMIESDCAGLCKGTLSYAGWLPGKSVVIDGVRHHEVLSPLGCLLHPASLRLVYLDASDEIIRVRLLARKSGEASGIAGFEQHATELQVGGLLRDKAHLVLNGAMSIEQLCEFVVEDIVR